MRLPNLVATSRCLVAAAAAYVTVALGAALRFALGFGPMFVDSKRNCGDSGPMLVESADVSRIWSIPGQM